MTGWPSLPATHRPRFGGVFALDAAAERDDEGSADLPPEGSGTLHPPDQHSEQDGLNSPPKGRAGLPLGNKPAEPFHEPEMFGGSVGGLLGGICGVG